MTLVVALVSALGLVTSAVQADTELDQARAKDADQPRETNPANDAVERSRRVARTPHPHDHLRSKNAGKRTQALRDLVSLVPPKEAVEWLTYSLATDRDWTVKLTAATLLGRLGAAARPALPYLRYCAGPCPIMAFEQSKKKLHETMMCEDTNRACEQSLTWITRPLAR